MIDRLRDALGQLRLLIDQPARLKAVELENAELLGRVINLERQVADVGAITTEIYLGGAVPAPGAAGHPEGGGRA